MLSMPPSLAHTAKSKAIKRSSVEGMSKRSAVCTAKSGAVETCGNRKAVGVLKRKLLTPAALVCPTKARQSTSGALETCPTDACSITPALRTCSIRNKQRQDSGDRWHNKHESMLAPVRAEGSAAYKSYHKCNALMQKHMHTEAFVTIT